MHVDSFSHSGYRRALTTNLPLYLWGRRREVGEDLQAGVTHYAQHASRVARLGRSSSTPLLVLSILHRHPPPPRSVGASPRTLARAPSARRRRRLACATRPSPNTTTRWPSCASAASPSCAGPLEAPVSPDERGNIVHVVVEGRGRPSGGPCGPSVGQVRHSCRAPVVNKFVASAANLSVSRCFP